MQFTHTVPVPVPRAAVGHHAMGIVGGDRRLGVINVEDVGGTRIVQHYVPRVVESDRVSFVSEASEGYLLRVLPFRMRVTWDMALSAAPAEGGDTSVLRCTIGFDAPRWVTTAGRLNRANHLIHHHLVEETAGFARDITAKYVTTHASA